MNSYRDYTTLHEGFFKDIVDLTFNSDPDKFWDHAKKYFEYSKDTDRSKFNSSISRNIATAAKGLTAIFPVIVTEATPLDQAVMISKAVERKAVAMLQMLFAANQITSANNTYDYLNKFHNNIDDSLDWSKANVDDVINATNDMENIISANENANIRDLIEINIKRGIEAVQEDIKMNCNYYLSESINPNSVNNYIVRNVLNDIQVISEAKVTSSNGEVPKQTGSTTTSTSSSSTATSKPSSRTSRPTRHNSGSPVHIQRNTSASDIMSNLKSSYDVLNKMVIKSDIEKANEAVPSLMIINFKSRYGERTTLNTAVVGVKAMIHYVSSEDMINKVMLKNSDRNGLFNFIRATTREISFFKDFLFAVDRAKVDALSKAGKGSTSSIWKLLELRANESKRRKSLLKNDATCSAIATIVITKAEVELIKKYHRIDLSKAGTLKSIMRGYSIMCAAIIDDAIEKVDFLWDDGSQGFETYSFSSLEREESSGMYKKVINMINKNAR